jgi:hypothetical protein
MHGMSAGNEASHRAKWERVCSKAQSTISGVNGSDITYSLKPAVVQKGRYWKIHMLEYPVLVPKLNYNSYGLYTSRDGHKQLTLASNEGLVFGFGRLDNGIIVAEGGPGYEETLDLVGGSKTVFDLTMLGYKYSSSDLTCDYNDLQNQKSIATILLFKGPMAAAKGDLAAAYEVVGEHRGWIEKAISQGQTRYDVYQYDNPEYVYVTTYILLKDHFQEAPFLNPNSIETPETQPDWINALSMALTDNTETAWAKFKNMANSHGLKELPNAFNNQ